MKTFAEIFDDIVGSPVVTTNWITWNVKQRTLGDSCDKVKRFPKACRAAFLDIGAVRVMKVKEWRYENISKDGRHVWIQADLTLDGKKEGTRLSSIVSGPDTLPHFFGTWSGGLNATELSAMAGSRLRSLVDAFHREAGEEWASKVRALEEHRAEVLRSVDSLVSGVIVKSAPKDRKKVVVSLAESLSAYKDLMSASPEILLTIMQMDLGALSKLEAWRGRNKAYVSQLSQELVKEAQDMATVKQVQES